MITITIQGPDKPRKKMALDLARDLKFSREVVVHFTVPDFVPESLPEGASVCILEKTHA